MGSIKLATARAHSNIAFIKYWGNIDDKLRLPANSSLSMNLNDLHTTTSVIWSDNFSVDTLSINGEVAEEQARIRVSQQLDLIRRRLSITQNAQVVSQNNFPMGTGIASSASSFAALTLAAVTAAGGTLSERELSTLARCGSGSASRSIPSGFVEWRYGETHEESYAETFVNYKHWDLVDVIVIVSQDHKKTGSTAGHKTANTSSLQQARVEDAHRRLQTLKRAIQEHDFQDFANIVEEDSNLMHAVMMTSNPPLFYWQPLTLAIMKLVREWRIESGLRVCYTLDAGPNVHCICIRDDVEQVISRLKTVSNDMEIRVSSAGQGAYIVKDSD